MTFVTPCARPENDPNAWFIERDGRQYPDETLVTEEELTQALEIRTQDEGESRMGFAIRVMEDLVDTKLRLRLISRRHAKDACFTQCIFRMHCLNVATVNEEQHGTWGGYYPEERRQIEKLRAEKAAEREARARE